MQQRKDVQLTGKLKWVERIASLMDDKFRVPGTNFRFGLDPILNFIPIAGDVSGFAVGASLLYVMAKNGVSRKVLIIMTLNICFDALLGAIPFVGQVSDFFFKSNTRNIQLLKEHYEEGKHRGSGQGIIIFLLIIMLIFVAGTVYLSYLLLHWLFTGW